MAGNHSLMTATLVGEKENPIKIKREEKMLWIGSCFVESMAPFLFEFQYKALVNPFGVIFHPSILAFLLEGSSEEIADKSFEKEGTWINYWLGAPFVAKSKEELKSQISEAVEKRNQQVENADWLIITFGTAFWYQHFKEGMVGKCHKIPQNEFVKRRSTINEIADQYSGLISRLRAQNPNLKIILTVSPVRHTRDTLELNSVSKSILRLASQELTERLENVFYFPAYELVLDELRDYRFFKSDLIHPTDEVVQYIWQRFAKQFFTIENQETNLLIQQFNQQKNHRPSAAFGIQFEKWKADLKPKAEAIEKRLLEGY